MKTFTIEAIRTRLQELKAQGIRPTHVAAKAGVPQSSISKFMRGQLVFSAQTIERLWPVLFDGEHSTEHKL